jgi:hypothetical protein
MSEKWYYVQKGNRHGPVAQDVIEAMIRKKELKQVDFVWKKGFDNWKKIQEVDELQVSNETAVAESAPALPPMEKKDFSFKDLAEDERAIFIRIGNDRGQAPSDYGPFSLKQLKQLFKENRINGKTFIFSPGMKEWMIMADLTEYQEVFEELPPVIQEVERRSNLRKPFLARLFIQNDKKLFEGICRDISIGGMQVLLDDFKGKSGDKISINVHPENSEYHFTADGVVVRILEGNSGFSFRFNNLNTEAREAIEKYVEEN